MRWFPSSGQARTTIKQLMLIAQLSEAVQSAVLFRDHQHLHTTQTYLPPATLFTRTRLETMKFKKWMPWIGIVWSEELCLTVQVQYFFFFVFFLERDGEGKETFFFRP